MNTYTFRRYCLFAIALFVNALGIALITKALLGTSPITSVTYVLSMFTPLTIGQWTIALNLLFVVLELPLMTRKSVILTICLSAALSWPPVLPLKSKPILR